jgi:hypothetical protein
MTMAEEKGGLQETNEPWKEPGQTSQDPSIQPPPDAVEQEKNKKGIRPGEPNPLKPTGGKQ